MTKKRKSNKKATTVEKQIALLRERGVTVSDEEKAKEILLDIGYYRLGFYLFPFEKTYPNLGHQRSHEVCKGTKIEDAVALYYFDFNLRNILYKYLARIEVGMRTTMIYNLSNNHKDNPYWFVDKNVVTDYFADNFETSVYKNIIEKTPIERHRQKYRADKFAPAWKTMEFMMFGNLTTLYDNLRIIDDKLSISKRFGIKKTEVFSNYIEVIRLVRNACAHGNVLYDFNSHCGVKKGPAGTFDGNNSHTLKAAISVIRFMLDRISSNRRNDMDYEINEAAIRLYDKCPKALPIVSRKTGITYKNEVKTKENT